MESKTMTFNPKFRVSERLYQQAQGLFPFGAQLFSRRPELGPYGQAPVFFERAKHAHFWDVDGNEFIDTAMAIGPVTLGYCYEPVDMAVKAQIEKSILGSVNSPLEIELANAIVKVVPCAEMVKFCKSGGEADAIAVRMARGYTGKDLILFCGYHGWHDWYLAANLRSQSLDNHLRPGISAKGVPTVLADTCLPFEYNNIDALRDLLERHNGQVAGIIMEATRFKSPAQGFLENVRQLADKHGCVLIFDEVVTGFRMALGGAQEHYGVTPDLATFAKGIANGYSLAAVAGKKDIMASQQDNFISSTYWGETASLAAGLATIKELQEQPVIETINKIGLKLMESFRELAQQHGVKLTISGHGFDFALSFDYAELSGKIMTLFMQEMIARGIYVTGCIYTCYTHTPEDVQAILDAADKTFSLIAKTVKDNNLDAVLKCQERLIGFRRLV